MSFSLDTSHPSGQRADLYWVKNTMKTGGVTWTYADTFRTVIYLTLALLVFCAVVYKLLRVCRARRAVANKPDADTHLEETDDEEDEAQSKKDA